MAKTPTKSALSQLERSVVKALLNDGWRNQDIHVLINTGRPASINFGRIANIKADSKIVPASPDQVEAFRRKKLLFNHVTGLCQFDDERLVRAREAMILAVELFNTPRMSFKAGVFSMLAHVAWTYLLHQYYASKGVQIISKDGYSLLLSKMIEREDCPLSKGCRQNLRAVGEIRNVAEHRTIGPFDRKWLPIFQSTCLNFEKALTSLFGERLTLGHDLGFVLQFAKMTTEEIAAMQEFDVPEHIAALDASLATNLGDGDADDLEYQFKVIYTFTAASKAKAHFQFVQPGSSEGIEIQNVLIKYRPLEDSYPFKVSQVKDLVAKNSGREFTYDTHHKAWKMFNVRPKGGGADPASTDKKYCLYNHPYKSYTYSQAWVDFLCAQIACDETWTKLKRFKL